MDNASVYDARGNGNGETVPTITGDHENRVTDYTALCLEPCSWDGGQVSPTLTANNAGGSQRMPDKENFNAVIEPTAKVRRLMPLECERLQGMPDDWSKYGIDENGKEYELSDSARYKIQGNGIATPFWAWLMAKISSWYDRTPTMASLFDGQASFPMIWENINGKGTAKWSSEIDRHATAVARYHFPEEEHRDANSR